MAQDGQPDIVRFNFFRVETSVTPVLSNAAAGWYRGAEREQLVERALLTTSKFGLSAWACLYSRAFLQEKNLRFTSEREICSEDYLFNLEALLLARGIRVLADSLYYYELRKGSLTQSYKKDLSEKYAFLVNRLRDAFRREGVLERWEERICWFYAWHLVHGICIPNEYHCTGGHTLRQGRKNVFHMLMSSQVQSAIGKCDVSRGTGRQRIQLWAMKMGWEPLFYWLYVIKPRIGKVEA